MLELSLDSYPTLFVNLHMLSCGLPSHSAKFLLSIGSFTFFASSMPLGNSDIGDFGMHWLSPNKPSLICLSKAV